MSTATGSNPMRGYYALRWMILERDNFTCQYCGQHAPDVKLEVDHKIAVVDGGLDTEDNLITSCYACNRGKSALSIMQRKGGKKSPAIYSSPILRSVLPYRMGKAMNCITTEPFGADTFAKKMNINIKYAWVLLGRLRNKGLLIKVDKNRWKATSGESVRE